MQRQQNNFFILFLLLVFSTLTYAQDDDTGDNNLGFSRWPVIIDNTVRDFTGQVSVDLQKQLFKEISDIEILNQDVSLYDDLKASLGIQVERKVYDNHNITNTFTVVDFMRVPINIPLFATGTVPTGSGFYWGFNIGTSIGFNVLNIRQVLPHNVDSLPNIDDMKDDIESSEWWIERKYNEVYKSDEDLLDRDPHVTEEDDEPKKRNIFKKARDWFYKDPLRHAQYSKFWNLVWAPFKLPLTVKHFNRLHDGEIVSYGVSGAIQLGAGAGFNIDVTSQSHFLDLGVNISTYLAGDFRIAVMKEKENIAWVKVTKVRSHGVAGSLGFSDRKTRVFDGFTILSKNVGTVRLAITPFNFTLSRNHAKQFDVGYRYDLTDPVAVIAYKKALTGRFAMSEDISRDPSTQTPPVTYLFTRKSKSRNVSRRYRTRLALLYSADSVSSRTFSDIKITLPDGSYRVFRTHTVNSRQWESVYQRYETFSYSFLYDMLYSGTIPGAKQTEGLVAEGRIEDAFTSGQELNTYITETEHAINQRGKFPRPPLREPLSDKKQKKLDQILAKAKDTIDESQTKFEAKQEKSRIKEHRKQEKIWAKAVKKARKKPAQRDFILAQASQELNKRNREWLLEWQKESQEEKEDQENIWAKAIKKAEDIRGKKARYGRSGFLYRLYFTKKQLMQFVQTPRHLMWKSLEKAFGKDPGTWDTPAARMKYQVKNLGRSMLNVVIHITPAHFRKGSDLFHARNLRRKWLRLQSAATDNPDPKYFLKRLGKFFMDQRYGYEIVKLLKTSVEGQELPYDINAFNRAFGTINEAGGSISSVNVLLERTDRMIAFDQVGPRIPINPDAITGGVKLEDNKDGTYKLRFVFNKEPKFIYFRVSNRENVTATFETTFKVIIANRNGRFKAGINEILLDRNGVGLSKALANAIFPGRTNTLSMAMSLNGQDFGRVDDDDEYINKIPDPDEDKAPSLTDDNEIH